MIKRRNEMRMATVEAPRDGKGTAEFQYVMEAEEMLASCTMFARIVLKPGAMVGRHPHVDDAEFYYILDGKPEVDDDGRMETLAPGDIVYTADGEHHSIANNTDEDVTMLAIIVR